MDEMPDEAWLWGFDYGNVWEPDDMPGGTKYLRADRDAALRKALAEELRAWAYPHEFDDDCKPLARVLAYLSQPEGG